MTEQLSENLRRAAAGDTSAFAAFYDATIGPAYLLARGLCGNRARAEAVLREAYGVAWRRAGEQPASGLGPRAWLCRVVQQAAAPTSATVDRRRDGLGVAVS